MRKQVSLPIHACVLLLTIVLLASAATAVTTETVILVAADGSGASGQVVVTIESGHTTLVATVSGLAPLAVQSRWEKFNATLPPFVTDPVLGLVSATDANLGPFQPTLPVTP